ncbi:unnamed protein product [Symbiodinium sp. CCMP2456]|nr:unnamed protein product [Symbiodinium sp. CCMP2456]
MTADPEERARLTRAIIARRHVERTDWMNQLYTRSRAGDAEAIKYLRQRNLPAKGSPHEFISCHGDLREAGRQLRDHYTRLFSSELDDSQQQQLCTSLAQLQARAAESSCADFTEDEIQQGVARLKFGKVSGPSGVSNEYLVALWNDTSGRALLVSHLNALLHADEFPVGFCDAFVALLPKVTNVTARVTRESKLQSYGIYLSCDIQAAFDNISQTAVLQFLLEESDPGLGRETLQLFKLIMSLQLHFTWQGQNWTIPQQSGVQQGGSHSAVVFAYVLGLAIQKLERSWRAQKETCMHSSFSLVFVDDLLVTFQNWAQADRLTAQLQPPFVSVLPGIIAAYVVLGY